MAWLSLLSAALLLPFWQGPAPDPANGYSDYLRAAEVIDHPDFAFYVDWTPDAYGRQLRFKHQMGGEATWTEESERRLAKLAQYADKDFLFVDDEWITRFGKALDLVKLGNTKRVWDPYNSPDGSPAFADLSAFKAINKMYAADAHLKFSAGNSRGAVASLIESLTFSRKLGGFSVVSSLVAIGSTSIALASFNENLPSISHEDAKRVIAYVDSALAEPPFLLDAIEHQAKFAKASMPKIVADLRAAEEDPSGLGAFVSALSPAEREGVFSASERSLKQVYAAMVKSFEGAERDWLVLTSPPQPPTKMATVADAADALTFLSLQVMGQTRAAYLKSRAQLRLLALHARILDYRWRYRRYPAKLDDAAPQALLQDPINGDTFQYELIESGYRLYSKGIPETGKIDLKYRFQPGIEAPPPLTH